MGRRRSEREKMRLELRDDLQPWERQEPDETELMHSRFLVYRDLGPETERLRQTVEVLSASGDTISYSRLKDIASRHRWVARAAAWDRYIVQADIGRMVKLRRQAIDDQRDVARRLRLRALEAIDAQSPHDLSPADVARYVELSWKIEKSIFDEYARSQTETDASERSDRSDAASWDATQRRHRLEQLRDELAKRAVRAADDDEVVS